MIFVNYLATFIVSRRITEQADFRKERKKGEYYDPVKFLKRVELIPYSAIARSMSVLAADHVGME